MTTAMLPSVDERISIIRGYVLGSELEASRPGFRVYADAAAAVVCPLAHIGITLPQALDLAVDMADQLRGGAEEIDHVIEGIRVEIVAGEPVDERTDTTELVLDGRTVVTVETVRGRLVRVETDDHFLASLSAAASLH